MDPLTQGVLGATLPQTIAKKPSVARAGLFGFLAGLTPDLDVLIKSETDPLLFLEYHRHFTHSLIFIPVGGLICGLLLYWMIGKRWDLSVKQSVLFCTLGYATHGVLDACTSYGTLLFWPFSDMRIAWNTVSVIDPLFTLPILVGVIIAGIKKKPAFARMALAWAFIYMTIGVFQRDAAIAIGKELAEKRGHEVLRIEAKPSFANLLVWKIVYETSDRYYVDAVRTGISSKIYIGSSLPKLDIARDFVWLDLNSQQAKDIERFRWFSEGFISQDPSNPHQIIDVRYSLIPNEIKALWFIEISPKATRATHAQFITNRRDISNQAKKLWAMALGR